MIGTIYKLKSHLNVSIINIHLEIDYPLQGQLPSYGTNFEKQNRYKNRGGNVLVILMVMVVRG